MSFKLSASNQNFSISLGTVAIAAAIAILSTIRGSLAQNGDLQATIIPVITVLALLAILAPFSWVTCAALLTFAIILLVNDYRSPTPTNNESKTIDWINVALAIALLVLAWFVY